MPDEVEWFSMCPFRNTQQSNKLSHSIAGKYGLGLTLEAEFIYALVLLLSQQLDLPHPKY